MDPKPPTISTPELEPKVLSFEEFIRRNQAPMGDLFPCYNNFHLYFTKGESYEARRNKSYYRRFESEHPDLARSLCEEIQKLLPWDMEKQLKPLEKDLYKAYKIMRVCGASDGDLFK